MRKKLFISICTFILIVLNPFLTLMLTYLGKCKTQYLQDSRAILLTECRNQTELLMKDVLHARAFVIGKNIYTFEKTLSKEVISHELAHVYQYKILGPLFLPLYGISQLIALVNSKIRGYTNIHALNYFEIWANKIAGLPPEKKY